MHGMYNIKTQTAGCDRLTHVEILGSSNLLSSISNKNHISAGVCRHNFVVWGRELSRENLDYEWNSRKAEVCCTLNYENHRPLCLGEDVIKLVYFLHLLENYSLLHVISHSTLAS